ncbi:MAG: MGMT family protein, partial [Candidatus Magasanikbacteria bacterium]|nr:MGMT family protein [Candidatus Magasanikbacteria bacterium]
MSDHNLSDFERSVLHELEKVPLGRVTTYQNLAKKVGKPKAARAVGNALNKNPWAPRVPCHRVVKSNGEIGGYAFGIEKKIGILKSEGV